MGSFVWNRSPQEAKDNPYEYAANDQFYSEASAILDAMYQALMEKNMFYSVNDTSLRKAEWMLLVDSVDGLVGAIEHINEKKHRISSRLFRDSVESLDLLTLFRSKTPRSKKLLKKWFDSKFIGHKEYRDHLEKTEGVDSKEESKECYKQLSTYTHRTYSALLDSYMLGKDSKIAHDSIVKSKMAVLPNTISYQYAVVAQIIIKAYNSLVISHQLSAKDISRVRDVWKNIEMKPSEERAFVQR